MKDQRKYFRYQFPGDVGVICTDDQDRTLIPIDISHGGLGFWSAREFQIGSTEKIHLLEFISLNVFVKFSQQTGADAPPAKAYKIGVEFVDYILTPQKLIEYLEIHLKHAPNF